MDKFAYKLVDLRAWGVTESDLKARGVIWERKLRKLGRKCIDLKGWVVTGNDLRARGDSGTKL